MATRAQNFAISDVGLSWLAQLRRLRALSLGYTNVSGEGLRCLAVPGPPIPLEGVESAADYGGGFSLFAGEPLGDGVANAERGWCGCSNLAAKPVLTHQVVVVQGLRWGRQRRRVRQLGAHTPERLQLLPNTGDGSAPALAAPQLAHPNVTARPGVRRNNTTSGGLDATIAPRSCAVQLRTAAHGRGFTCQFVHY